MDIEFKKEEEKFEEIATEKTEKKSFFKKRKNIVFLIVLSTLILYALLILTLTPISLRNYNKAKSEHQTIKKPSYLVIGFFYSFHILMILFFVLIIKALFSCGTIESFARFIVIYTFCGLFALMAWMLELIFAFVNSSNPSGSITKLKVFIPD